MKCRKRLMSLVLALVMISGLTTWASAADTTRTQITAYLDYNITIQYNDKAQTLVDVNGNQVYPISYNGTTYVPIRAIGYLLGLSVGWDGATQTVTLDKPSTGTAPAVTAKPDSPAKKGTKEIKTYVEPGITVKYNGKAQTMKDAAGNQVYPILNEGTTYLPIRAVSNMLNIGVDWDGATQTVLLNNEDNTATDDGAVIVSPDKTTVDKFLKEQGLYPTQISVPIATVENIRQVMEQFGYPDSTIENAIAVFEVTGPNNGNEGFIWTASKKDQFKTSKDAKVISNTHVANDYVEVDLSTAGDGYVRVRLTKQVYELVYARIERTSYFGKAKNFLLKLDQWVNIPLLGKNDYYRLTVYPGDYFSFNPANGFNVAFIADIENPNGFALVSNPEVDFENAPKTVAKAAELTKNCKTDAEKITAIFEFVAKTIKPGKGIEIDQTQSPLDHILDAKTGVCNHYAILMAGMLRSQGIPCKVVWGEVYYNNKDLWDGHVWVSVSPDTKGLDMTRLGAGHDDDGWIRLDPTWASAGGTSGRSQAAIDKNHKTGYAY